MAYHIGKKAVLISPKMNNDTFWSFSRSFSLYLPKGKFGLPKVSMPPLGLLGLGRHLKGYYEEVILFDRSVDSRPLSQMVKGADHVYIGAMVAQEEGFREDVKILRKLGKVIIAGGPLMNHNDEMQDMVDHVIVHEAEMVIDEFLVALGKGKAKHIYEGKRSTPEKFFIPDYSLIDFSNYANIPFQISRGCVHDCEFCDVTAVFGREIRIAPVSHVLDALQQIYKTKMHIPVFICDDNLIAHPPKMIPVLEAIKEFESKQKYKLPKFTQFSMMLADDSPMFSKMRKLIRDININMGFVGVETNNPLSLTETGKRQNLRGDMGERLRFITKETGCEIIAGIIIGFDNDTRDTVDSLIKFINGTHMPIIMAGLLTTAAGTKLHERLRKEGRLQINMSGNNTDGRMNFIPMNFSAQEIEGEYLRFLKSVYNERAFFKRMFRLLGMTHVAMPVRSQSILQTISQPIAILTKERGWTYLRHLPRAIGIAFKRFSFDPKRLAIILTAYFTLCAEYTHIRWMMDKLIRDHASIQYEPWQKKAWKDR